MPANSPEVRFEANYDQIDPAQTAALLDEALRQASPEVIASDSKFVLLTLAGDNPCSDVARSIERQQFEAYFGNDAAIMGEEYGLYDPYSVFFLVFDRQQKTPAGTMRLIQPNPSGLKSINDITSEKCQLADGGGKLTNLEAHEVYEIFGLTPEKTVDVATIAVLPEYGEKATGSPIIMASMMRALYFYTLERDQELVAIIDEVPLKKLLDVHLPIETNPAVKSPFEYLGAKGNSFIKIEPSKCWESIGAFNQGVRDYMLGTLALFGETSLDLNPR